ncbi:MAG: hypothetical protein IJQ02_11960 [Oscillospiraceae bacterium]|nr:hypothetical protein [Oscillospiraceae bacterium]
MEEKISANGYTEQDYKVHHEVTGNAEFDFSVAAEIKIVRDDQEPLYIGCYKYHYDYEGYYVAEESAFEDVGDERREPLESYPSLKRARRSKFYPFIKKVDKINDDTHRSLMEKLDDTRNYPSGRSCSVNMDMFFEYYSEDQDLYYQINEPHTKGEVYIYSASEESYYLSKYMGPFYPLYFKETKKEKYLFQVSELEALSWDSPHRLILTQLRGIQEIRMRQSSIASYRYSGEESVTYPEGWTPLSLLVDHRMHPEKQEYYTVASISFINEKNEMRTIYTQSLGEVLECVVTDVDMYSADADRSDDVVYITKSLALDSEWGEYFALVDELRIKRMQGKPVSNWHVGATDVHGVLQCSIKPIPQNRYYLWSESIPSEDAEKLPNLPENFRGGHLRLIMFLDEGDPSTQFVEWANKNNIKIDNCDEEKRDYICKVNDIYFHMFITNECKPYQVKLDCQEMEWYE